MGLGGPYAEEQTWELQKMHLEAKRETSRALPLEIRKSFFHHEGGQNWNRFTREVQA